MNIPLCRPDITQLELDYVTEVLRSGQLSLGPRVAQFEEKFAAYLGVRHAIAVNSGTSALHLAVRALDIGAHDEVITTSFSFVASANCLLFENALPIFVDIDPDTFNLDPAGILRFIQRFCVIDRGSGSLVDVRTGRNVRAILPVHVFGVPCDMTAILKVAARYDLKVIEDACEALGASHRGQPVGTFGDIGVFAFYPNKQMTTGEGGMLVTNDEAIAVQCRSMRNQGRAAHAEWLCHERLGYNYRLSDIHCALGLAQLERIWELLAGRARVAGLYERTLAGHPLIKLPNPPPDCQRSWFVYPIQLIAPADALRDQVLHRLRAAGIGCQAYFPAIHLQPYFRQHSLAQPVPLPHTEAAARTCFVVPMFPGASEEEIDYVCQTLLDVLRSEVLTGAATLLRNGAIIAGLPTNA